MIISWYLSVYLILHRNLHVTDMRIPIFSDTAHSNIFFSAFISLESSTPPLFQRPLSPLSFPDPPDLLSVSSSPPFFPLTQNPLPSPSASVSRILLAAAAADVVSLLRHLRSLSLYRALSLSFGLESKHMKLKFTIYARKLKLQKLWSSTRFCG